MDSYKNRFYTSVAGLVIIIVMFCIMVVTMHPSSYHSGRYFSGMIGMIFLMAMLVCTEYYKRQEALSGPPGSRSDASIIMGAKERFDKRLLAVLTWGFSLVTCFVVLYSAYTLYGSLPFLLVVIGVLVACYGFVKLRFPGTIQAMAFGTIALFAGFATVSVGMYLVAPGFTPAGLVPQILANPFPLIFALVIIGIPVWSWFRVGGFPLLHPPTAEELREPCNGELTLSRSYDQVFERCRESLTLLPGHRIDNDEPSYGLLEATVQPEKGRASTIRFNVEKINDHKTLVAISIESPGPVLTGESGKRTYMNEKYLQIIDGYLRSAR